MPVLKIDEKEVEVPVGVTVLQACELAGVEIPRFCYHERLSVAGNCRMCLVELERAPKPIASCAMPVADGMVIKTKTDKIKKARNGVMEFLLANHPLDCPICDQGGECDLQDQAMAYGYDRGRFSENKRAVKDKYLGPLIKTIMTRCIHCTRCVRFATEVAGVEELGATGRGESMEVGTYVEKALTSELSGNMIDLCPVGALTSKPYAFTARSWELNKTETIDVHDALGSNIRIDSRGAEVMRILPRINEEINEEWISDKTRFSYDGLKRQRLDRPYIRKKGQLVEASWDEAFALIKQKIGKKAPEKMAALVGDLADCESIKALKDLMTNIGVKNKDYFTGTTDSFKKSRKNYLFNSSLSGIYQADACLLIGTNPRWEASVLNAKLRKAWLDNGLQIAGIGPDTDLTYPVEWLGETADILDSIISGKSSFSKVLKKAKKPMIIVGSSCFERKDSEAILSKIDEVINKYNIIQDDWNGYNILHKDASRVGALDLSFFPEKGGLNAEKIIQKADEIDVLYLLNVDGISLSPFKKSFIVYQGHHGDQSAHDADVILPSCAFTEKEATYVNLEGKVQRTQKAIFSPGDAKEDWKIIRALSEILGNKLPYNSLSEIREAMIKDNPVFDGAEHETKSEKNKTLGKSGKMLKAPLQYAIENFYMTNVISRASKTMAECSQLYVEKEQEN